MSRSRPASSPVSYHKQTKQYYVTRGGRRIYLGADHEQALKKYYKLKLGIETSGEEITASIPISVKELANRFLSAQMANWRDSEGTLRSYKQWLGRFIKDNKGALATEYSAEQFAHWKLLLKKREYSPETINHFLCAVRAMFRFAEDTGLMAKSPKLRRVKNEQVSPVGSKEKPLYTLEQVQAFLEHADIQMEAMILLALNCGFGPKDLHDLTWDDISEDRITLPRSKTGVCQTYQLWLESQNALQHIKTERTDKIKRLAKRNRIRSDGGYTFVTRYWRPWNKDAIAEQFRKLCVKAKVPCYGFYRLRHCAATAMSMVANPHVQRRFMRHSQLQQQVTYTHVPDAEVDKAVWKAREKLLGKSGTTSTRERNQESDQVA